MRLHLYFARRFLATFAASFALFLIMLALIDMLEEVRKFNVAEIGFLEVLRLTALNLPKGVSDILPLIMILTSVFLFLNLARTSEMVVVRAAGRSALRSLMAPAAAGFLLGALAVAILNPIVAATSTRYDALAAKYSGKAATMSLGGDTLWLRQGNKNGQTVIRAAGSSLDGTELRGVTFMGFTPDGTPTYRIEALRAQLISGAWELTNAKEWRFSPDNPNPELTAKTYQHKKLTTDLTLERIRDSFGTPSSIPIWDLPGFIRQLEHAGFSARSQRVWLQMQLASPLMLTAMVMIGASFTIRHVRFGRTGMMVLFALLLGFGLHFIRNFAQILGERGQIPIELAAWAPPVAGVMLSLGLLLNLEDG